MAACSCSLRIRCSVSGATGETPVAPLTLQRIRKLQEQAAIPDDPVAGFQTAGNLRLPIQTFSERNRASAKLVRRCRRINKRLVLGIAQDSRIREQSRKAGRR